jgi:nitroimidazol reductase NimA-like FMN-containing flavoprotein (pyridoxamine 5'-phosphate oxidase superfamily)
MLGRLTKAQCVKLLRENSVGRVGVTAGGVTYVVPITYVFDGDSVYGHSVLGQKVRMMRRNPSVGFEVEAIDDLANWRSVIAQGTYEELSGDVAAAAAKLIRASLPKTRSETAGPSGTRGKAHVSYRIRLREMTGRYERTARGRKR